MDDEFHLIGEDDFDIDLDGIGIGDELFDKPAAGSTLDLDAILSEELDLGDLGLELDFDSQLDTPPSSPREERTGTPPLTPEEPEPNDDVTATPCPGPSAPPAAAPPAPATPGTPTTPVPAAPADDGADPSAATVTAEDVELFQNERCLPVVGFDQKHLLPIERGAFSSRDGRVSYRSQGSAIDDGCFLTLGCSWAPASSWAVDKGGGGGAVDSSTAASDSPADVIDPRTGWSFAEDFGGPWTAAQVGVF
jgi:hypothetical protein